MCSLNSVLFLLPFLLLFPICYGQENPTNCTIPSFPCPKNSFCVTESGICQATNQNNTPAPSPQSSQFQIQCGNKTCQKDEICVRSPTTNMGPGAAGEQQQPPQQKQCVKFNPQPCYNQFGRTYCAPGQFCIYQIENVQTQPRYLCVSIEDQQTTICENQQQPNEG